MKTAFYTCLLFMMGIVSCKKDNSRQALQGKYTGTFERVATGMATVSSNVTLDLRKQNFSGTAQYPKYPAICTGNWNTNGSSIHFNDACMWTADFDGTLILDGDFDFEFNGSVLKIVRNYGPGFYDTYTLEKN